MSLRQPERTSSAARIALSGSVQGCGVRPAIVCAAQACSVVGWVENTGDQVSVHAQGAPAQVEAFIAALASCLPRQARLDQLQVETATVLMDVQGFGIRQQGAKAHIAHIPDIPADRAICDDCMAELFDTESRRYLWPFIACSACGPRYAWLRHLPFVRSNTTFSDYQPCTGCRDEYSHSGARRFGMELIACPACGPVLHYRDSHGEQHGNHCWQYAVKVLRHGGIVALQSFSGFHLLARADDANAVARIREFKSRRSKPLAVMVASSDMARRYVKITPDESVWLCGEHRPAVLLKKNDPAQWPWIAPDNPRWGVMLPHNGIQALILDALGEVVVATSGNRRGEPVASGMAELLPWLGKGIDAICYHDIPVWQAQDDSVVSVLDDGPLLLRRARGFAHEVLPGISDGISACRVAEGALLKNTVALRSADRILVSQYLGDMDNVAVARRRLQVQDRLLQLCGLTADMRVADAHPEAESPVSETPLQAVFHHRAHAAALIAEMRLDTPALIAAWDGIGYGEDGVWWGSEVFLFEPSPAMAARTNGTLAGAGTGLYPVFGLEAFPLPGGDRCSREPWRVMAALLLAAGIPDAGVRQWLATLTDGAHCSAPERELVVDALQHGYAFPKTTSMGRFLEALACLVLQIAENTFESHAACQLEYAAAGSPEEIAGHWPMHSAADAQGVWRWQWQPMVQAVWHAVEAGHDKGTLARQVLASVAELLLVACRQNGLKMLGVSGGCFQNRFLLEYLLHRCRQEGFVLIRPRRLPPNDGAIAYGQLQIIQPRQKN